VSKIAISGAATGTATFTIESPATSTNRTITIPDATTTLVGTDATQTLTNKTLTSPTITGANMSSMASSVITSGTSQASTSGTSIDFTGIPSWVKRITVMFSGVSTNGTSFYQVQLGSGSVTTSGYISVCANIATTPVVNTQTSGFLVNNNATGADNWNGHILLTNISGFIWVQSGTLSRYSGGTVQSSSGNITLSGTLDQVRITTVNGTDTFDAGSINILYE
jgi:hypothetical protein